MSFIKRQFKTLDKIAENADERVIKKVEEKYKDLDQSLARLIDDTRNDPKFPEDAEETLYDFLGSSGENVLAFVENLRDTYVLTKEGVVKVLKFRKYGERVKNLKIGKISPGDLVKDRTDPEMSEIVCDNIQRIIDKYKIKVDEKKYLKK